MKLKSKELKRMARETLNGRYNQPMGALVISQLLVMVITMPFQMTLGVYPSTSQVVINYLALFIISLLSAVLSCGLVKIHLSLARGKETKLSDIFYFFQRRPDRMILSSLLLMVITMVVMIPSIISLVMVLRNTNRTNLILLIVLTIVSLIGVIFISLTYNFLFYLLVDYPQMGILSAFKESQKMMKRNKGRLFYLGLSFLPMVFLGLLSMGIGFLWVSPYIAQTTTKFYQGLTGEI